MLSFLFAVYLFRQQKKNELNDGDQDTNTVSFLSFPESSGYTVTERWNDTTIENVNKVAVSADGNYMAVVTQNPAVGGEAEISFYNTSDHDGIPEWTDNLGAFNFDSLAISDNGS